MMTEQEKAAVQRLANRVIKLTEENEARRSEVATLVTALCDALDRVAALEDQIDVALGRPPKEMTEEAIDRALQQTTWRPPP